MTAPVRIRPIAEGDWADLTALERAAYAPLGLSEDQQALASRVRASPGTCFALDADGRLGGYLLSLPYPRFRYPDLARGEQVCHRSSNLHLHDLVVAQPLRRRGLASRLVRHLLATAAEGGYRHVSLVAVGGSDAFWSAHGFTPEAVPPAAYGPGAVYMSRPLHGTD
jgi:ornithine decarboxylase